MQAEHICVRGQNMGFPLPPPPSLTGPIPVSRFQSFLQTSPAPDLNISTSSATMPSCSAGTAPQTLIPRPTRIPSPAGRIAPASEALGCIPVGSISTWQGLKGLGTSTCKQHWWCALCPKGKEAPGGTLGVLPAGQEGIPPSPPSSLPEEMHKFPCKHKKKAFCCAVVIGWDIVE